MSNLPRLATYAMAVLLTSASCLRASAQTPAAAPVHAEPAASASSDHKRTASPPGAYVYIGWPNDGEIIHKTKVRVWFGTRSFGVAPAGTNVLNTGHHHLLIDTDLSPMDEPIPNDKQHIHFGAGQTETEIELAPGTHTLQLLMGDGGHVPHDPPLYSKKITIHVRAN